jgi:hypothetical protein
MDAAGRASHEVPGHATMMSRLHLRLGLLPLLAALAGCSNFVEGNGVYAEKVLEPGKGLAPFSSATIGFPGDVDVSGHPPAAALDAGAQVGKVVLYGDENVIEHIKVQVDGSGRLYLTIDVDGYSSVIPPGLSIDAPGLGAVQSKGGSVVTVKPAPVTDFAVTAGDKGQVILDGAGGGALAVALSGGAQLDASAYPVRAAHLALTGASRATVWPEQPPTGTAAEGSAVLVKGSATCAMDVSSGSSCGPLP